MAKERKSLIRKKTLTPVKSNKTNDENIENKRITRRRSARSREKNATARINLNTDCMPTTLFSNKNSNKMDNFEEVDYIKRLSEYNLQVLNQKSLELENEQYEQRPNETPAVKRKALTDLTNQYQQREESEEDPHGCDENTLNKRLCQSTSTNLNYFNLNELENVEQYYLFNYSSDESTSLRKREVAEFLANLSTNQSFYAASSPLVQTEDFVPLDSHNDYSSINFSLTTPQKSVCFSPTYSPCVLSPQNVERPRPTLGHSTGFVTLMMSCESDDYDIYNINNNLNKAKEDHNQIIKIIEPKKPGSIDSSSMYYVKEIDECGFTIMRPTGRETQVITQNPTIARQPETCTVTTPENTVSHSTANTSRSKRTLNSSAKKNKRAKKELNNTNNNKSETTVSFIDSLNENDREDVDDKKEDYFDQTDLDFLDEYDGKLDDDDEDEDFQVEKKAQLSKKQKEKDRVADRREKRSELYFKDINLLDIKAEKIGKDNELFVYALKVARILFTDEELSHGKFVDGNKSRSKLREPLDELRTKLLKDALIYKFDLDQSMFDMVWKGIKVKLNTRIQRVV